MVNINEVTIISVDKNDMPWYIEGEILFESDLGVPFSAAYYPDDGEFEELELEMDPGCDKRLLREMIITAAEEFEE